MLPRLRDQSQRPGMMHLVDDIQKVIPAQENESSSSDQENPKGKGDVPYKVIVTDKAL